MLPYSEQERFKKNIPEANRDTDLDYFFSNAYHDMRFFLESTTKSSSSLYTYFGDVQKKLYYISDNFKTTFGFEGNVVEDLPSKWRERIYNEQWRQLFDRDIKNTVKLKCESHSIRYQVLDSNGKVAWIRNFECVQWNEDRSKALFVAGRIDKQDDYFSIDPLTNFISEQTLYYRLEQLKKIDYNCTTIGFSFNNMSEINTKYGRKLGDRLIASICQQLMEDMAGKASFYRLIGMRCFVIVDNDVKTPDDEIVEELREIIERGYRSMDIQVQSPCSFALMKFPQEMSPKDYVETMVSLTRLAEKDYSQKYIINTPENLKKISDGVEFKMGLSSDVLNNMKDFQAVVQPVVCAKTGEITAGEMLMRWRYNGKSVSPGIFIPLLEQNQLIIIAGKWIIEQAVKFCSEIVKYNPDFALSVNLSMQQLFDDDLFPHIFRTLDHYKLDGSHLVLEMTESCMIKEPEKFVSMINACHERGVKFALDDFGAGYSSIKTLMHYDIDIVKLDKSLLPEIEESELKLSFIRGIVDACHQLDRQICIEGIETDGQREFANVLKCDYIQGFYFYRPMATDEATQLIIQQKDE